MLEFSLKFFKLPVNSFVVCGQSLVYFLESLVLLFILFSEVEVPIVESGLPFLQLFMVLVILFLLFLQDLEIVVQLLCVELIEGLHLLITLL